VPEAVGAWDLVSVTEGDWLGEAVLDTEGVCVVEPLCVCVWLWVNEADCDTLALVVCDPDGVTLAVIALLGVVVALALCVCDALAVVDLVRVELGVCDVLAVSVWLPLCDCVCVCDAVRVSEELCVCDEVCVVDAVTVEDELCIWLAERVALGDCDTLGVAVVDGDPDSVEDWDVLEVGMALGVSVCDAVIDWLPVTAPDADWLCVELGVSLCV